MLGDVATAAGVRSVAGGGRRLVDLLAGAFAADPWITWSLPSPGAARSLYSLFLRTVAFPSGLVLVAGDPVVGVAVALPPGTDVEPSAAVGAEVLALHGRRIGPALDADAVLERFRPAEPGWVLHSLAVAPAAQGGGVGDALVAELVGRAAGTPISVETANPAAVRMYRRHGFAVDDVVDLAVGWGLAPAPDGTPPPTVWLLSRA
jgi:ribosomal protein S18 acetylase RimI-like enzyme